MAHDDDKLPDPIAAASTEGMTLPLESSLDARARAVLAMDIAWVQWRSDFRRKLVETGILDRPWRSVFEADMIFSIVAHWALTGQPITLKALATYFGMIATEATVSRHVDDMQEAGMLERRPDMDDRRRLFLVPTRRLEAVGQEFLSARIRIMQDHGFVWTGPEAAGGTAVAPPE